MKIVLDMGLPTGHLIGTAALLASMIWTNTIMPDLMYFLFHTFCMYLKTKTVVPLGKKEECMPRLHCIMLYLWENGMSALGSVAYDC